MTSKRESLRAQLRAKGLKLSGSRADIEQRLKRPKRTDLTESSSTSSPVAWLSVLFDGEDGEQRVIARCRQGVAGHDGVEFWPVANGCVPIQWKESGQLYFVAADKLHFESAKRATSTVGKKRKQVERNYLSLSSTCDSLSQGLSSIDEDEIKIDETTKTVMPASSSSSSSSSSAAPTTSASSSTTSASSSTIAPTATPAAAAAAAAAAPRVKRQKKNAATSSTTTSSTKKNKKALVMGNNNYKKLPPLRNAVNDAFLMSHALTEVGFVVDTRVEIETGKEFKRVVDDFVDGLQRGDEALVFFAGHGATNNSGHSLLYATRSGGFDLGGLMPRIRRRECSIFGIILDCCRETPQARGSAVGLRRPAVVLPLANTFVAYACAQGELAADGTDGNGLYTQHLVEHIMTPDLDICKLFRRVCADVYKASRGRQEPWHSEALKIDSYCLCLADE